MSNSEMHEGAVNDEGQESKLSIEELQAQLSSLSKKFESEKESKERILAESQTYKSKWQELREKEETIASKLKEEEENKLKEKGQFEILLKQREEAMSQMKAEMENIKGELSSRDQAIVNFRKAAAFEAELGGKLKKQGYWNHVDFDKIAINPESGEVDVDSVKLAAGEFIKDYKELITFPNAANLPNGTAASGNGSLSYKQWQALPLAEKKKRIKDVRD